MNRSLSNKKLREFAYILGIGFPFFIGFLIPFITGHGFSNWTLLISLLLILIGLLAPSRLNILYKAWMKLAYVLGWVNGRIILSLVFLLVLIQIAFIMKFLGYDPIKSKKRTCYSYKEEIQTERIDLTSIF